MTSTLPPPPRPPDISTKNTRARWRYTPSTATLGAFLLGGAAFDLGSRHPVGVLSFLSVALTVTAATTGRWVRGTLATRILLLSLVPAFLLMVRASLWLVPLNIVATLSLLILAVVVRDEEEAIPRAVGRIVRIIPLVEPMLFTGDFVGQATTHTIKGRRAALRQLMHLGIGLAIALPLVLALTTLLAASDALFSSWLDVADGVPVVLGHLITVLIGAGFVAAWATHGAWRDPAQPARVPKLIGATETAVVLTSIAIAFAAFVAAQVVAIASGPAYVERTTGLTYAEYAREGFFQLVAAAVLTLVVLVSVGRLRAVSSHGPEAWIRRLELTIVALTLAVVAVAIRRLFLYEAEFGLTMLRLSTIIFAAFIGFVFVVIGASVSGRLRRSPVTVVLAGALALLIAVNVANPEAIVAERNIERFGASGDLDIGYLVRHLGPDAYPAISTHPEARQALCQRELQIDDRWITFNFGRVRAAAVCGS